MTEALNFDVKRVEEMNRKAIENQFFTPDNVYIDLSLFKDVPIGLLYADHIHHQRDAESFGQLQTTLTARLKDYQQRLYDTVDYFFDDLGCDDDKLDQLLASLPHDLVFLTAPATYFLRTLVRDTIRNKNNSAPANKFAKRKIDKDHFVLEAIPVTYYINTFPLTLTTKLMTRLAEELGESLGVNIQFLNKDPQLFDQRDWDTWMEKIDCFYLDNLGRMTRSEFVLTKQGELAFVGVFFKARKRFEKSAQQEVLHLDFDHQIQMATAQLDLMCDFTWLPNNDIRLTEEPLVSVDIEDPFDHQESNP